VRILVIAAAGSLLAGCAGLDLSALIGDGAAAPPIESPEDLQTVLGERPLTPRTVRQLPVGRQGLPEITPSALTGARAPQVTGWMGPPDGAWEENGHAIWRYVEGECVVLLFIGRGEVVRDVKIVRTDGKGDTGCNRAISKRVAAARSS